MKGEVHIMEKKIVVYVSSGKELGEPTRTKLTLDYANCTEEDIRNYADDSCIIKWRATYKNSKKAYPTEATYIVPKPGTRAAPQMSDEEMFAALAKKYTPEQFTAELKRRMGVMPEDEDPKDDPEMLVVEK
jgi:hypothetical protein